MSQRSTTFANGPPSPWLPLLRVRLLGAFQVYRGEHLVTEAEWKRRKAKTLFKLLLLAPHRTLAREQAIELIWPEADPQAAARNLNTVLYTLRRALCPDPTCPATAYVALEGERLLLNSEHIAEVDADVFAARAKIALAQPGDRRACEEALQLYAGDLLPEDVYEDWAVERREALRSQYLDLLLRVAALCQRVHDFDSAIDALQQLVAFEPTHEEGQRALMRAYALAGRRHDALRQYQRCVEVLRRDLEAEPLPETVALYADIRGGRLAPAPAARRAPQGIVASGPFVGRHREVQEIQDAFDRVSRGRAGVAMLRGEMGIGKTRLAHEALAGAAGRGALVLEGGAHEDEGLLPYGPLAEALRGYLRSQPETVIHRHFGPVAGELVRLLPELRSLVVAATQPTALDLALAQTRLFHAVVHSLRSLAAQQTVVLFVDDAHGADPATLQLLSYLVRNTRDLPLLLLLAARDEGLRADHPLRALTVQWHREGICLDLHLAPLSSAASAQLVSLLGVDPRVAPRIFAVAEGNPLFTHELVRAIKEGGAPSALPPRLREVLGTRLHGMPGPLRALLGLCAAIGEDFSYDLARAASGTADRALLDALDEALAVGVIEERGSVYHFRHGLLRQAFYDTASARRRVYWHRRIAEALEQLYADRLAEHAEPLARHWEAAQVWEGALRYTLLAAERASQVYATEAAVQFYRQAQSLLNRVQGDRRADRLVAAEGLGDALVQAGSYAPAEEQYQTALSLATDMPRVVGLYARLGLTCERQGEFGRAIGYLEEGRARLAGEPPSLEEARLYETLGLVYNNHGEHQLGLDFTRQALAMLQQLPPTRAAQEARATALRQLGMGLGEQGEHEAALRAFGECLAIVEDLEDESFMAMALNCLGSLHVRRGEHEQAVAYLKRGLQLAQRVGDPHVQALCRVNLGDSFQARGDVAAALPHLREAARLAEETGARSLAHYIYGVLVATTLAQGDLDAARMNAQRAWTVAEALGNPRDLGVAAGLLGEVASARGEWDLAETHFARAFALLAPGEHRFARAQVHRQYACMLLQRGAVARGRAELHLALEDFKAVGAAGEVAATEELIARLHD